MLENSLDKKDENQTAVLELEYALKNAETAKNTSLIKNILLKYG